MRDEQYINDLNKKLLRKYPYFGSTINKLEFKVVPKEYGVKTAGTNGKMVYMNDEFLDTLNEKEQLFLAAHEVAHVALEHIERQKGKVHKLWNIACDAVINKYLEKDDLPIIKGGVNITDALQYDAEELYYKLLKKQKENQKNKKSKNKDKRQQDGQGEDEQDQDQNPNNEGVSSDDFDIDSEDENPGHASHDMWDELEKENEEESENSEGSSSGNGDEKEDEEEKEGNSSGNGKDDKEDENEENKEDKDGEDDKKEPISEREEFEKNKQQRIKMAKDIMKKINHNKDRSQDGAGEEALVGDVGEASTPVTNWKRVLARTFEVEDEVWGHRFSDKGNNWAARIEDIELDDDAETEIIVDTSGSISYSLLRAFLKQTKTVLRVSKVKVGEFNNDFYGFQELKSEKDIDELKLNIGGGTNFDAASRAFSKDRYVNKICFTDGQDGGNAGIQEKRDDILWISFENPNFKPDNGKVLFVPADKIECFEQSEKSKPETSFDDDFSM